MLVFISVTAIVCVFFKILLVLTANNETACEADHKLKEKMDQGPNEYSNIASARFSVSKTDALYILGTFYFVVFFIALSIMFLIMRQ
jgi:hypothetical protein